MDYAPDITPFNPSSNGSRRPRATLGLFCALCARDCAAEVRPDCDRGVLFALVLAWLLFTSVVPVEPGCVPGLLRLPLRCPPLLGAAGLRAATAASAAACSSAAGIGTHFDLALLFVLLLAPNGIVMSAYIHSKDAVRRRYGSVKKLKSRLMHEMV